MKKLKVVYVGPVLAGKAQNLQALQRVLGGELVSLASETERTLSLTASLPCVDETRGVEIATVPGAIFYNHSRINLLRDADCVVFVADSQRERMEADREEAHRLLANLVAVGRTGVPIVLQANKQDLLGATDSKSMAVWLSLLGPIAAIDACAMTGVGTLESLHAVLAPFSLGVRWDELRDRMRASAPRSESARVERVDLSLRERSLGDSFRDLRNRGITRVQLRGLSTLPAEIGSLGALESLDLEDSALSEIPPEVGRLTSLRTLSLARNALRRLPEELCNAASLSFLSLDGNPLEELPSSLGRLRSLRTLLLRDVPLTRLPESLPQAQALELLWMRGTRFRTPPPELGELPLFALSIAANDPPLDLAVLFDVLRTGRLEFLDLSHSGITTLPAGIAELRTLVELDLTGNPLRAPPQELSRMEALEAITLELDHLDPGGRRALVSCLPAMGSRKWFSSRHSAGSTTFRRSYGD